MEVIDDEVNVSKLDNIFDDDSDGDSDGDGDGDGDSDKQEINENEIESVIIDEDVITSFYDVEVNKFNKNNRSNVGTGMGTGMAIEHKKVDVTFNLNCNISDIEHLFKTNQNSSIPIYYRLSAYIVCLMILLSLYYYYVYNNNINMVDFKNMIPDNTDIFTSVKDFFKSNIIFRC